MELNWCSLLIAQYCVVCVIVVCVINGVNFLPITGNVDTPYFKYAVCCGKCRLSCCANEMPILWQICRVCCVIGVHQTFFLCVKPHS